MIFTLQLQAHFQRAAHVTLGRDAAPWLFLELVAVILASDDCHGAPGNVVCESQEHSRSNSEFELAPKWPSHALLPISLKSTKPETKKLGWYRWEVQKSFQVYWKQLLLSEVLRWEFEQMHAVPFCDVVQALGGF